MSSLTHLAVLDDEVDITRLLSTYLQAQGFRVTELHRGDELLRTMRDDPPALVLLDLGLPGEDGFGIARQLREHWHCGLVIVSGRGDAVDKVVGLEVGADDYVTKPFDLRELLARIKAVLRRLAPPAAVANASPAAPQQLRFAGWLLDLRARRLVDDQGCEVALTGGEFDLLRTLASHPGRVLSRDFLLDATRGREAGPFDRTIDVQIGRLRRKLEPDAGAPTLIKSVRGAGYILVPAVEAGMTGGADSQLLQALFGAHPDALLLVGADGCITRANPAAELLLGYSRHELQGMAIETLVPSAVRSQHAAYRQAYGAAPRARPMGLQMELAALRKDGSQVMVEIALSPLQGPDPPQVVAAIRDVASYPRVRQALKRLRFSEHLAQLGRLAVDAREPQSVLSQAPAIAALALETDAAMLFLHDGDGDGSGSRLVGGVGLPEGELPGQRCSADETGLAATMPARYAAAGMRSMLAVPLSDRGRTIGVLAVASRGESRFGDDERRFLEAMANLLATSVQRARSEEALAHAQRLESVGQLTGGIAHDFNNLLTIILGNLQVLEALPPGADEGHGRQLVAAATRAANRGAELTGKLLAFSRRQLLQPSAVDARQLLQSLAGMLRRTLDQRILIEVDVPVDCPALRADPGQLESALLNIAINARDAMHDGGTLRFAARACESLPAGLDDVLDELQRGGNGFVAISVSDTGSGMSEAVRQRAFEPFFTTKDLGRGTGLGLATVYGFARQSRGAVALRSAPGAGTSLSLYLPQLPRIDSQAASDAQAGAEALPHGLRVLLVEDDAEVREVVRAFLQGLHCRVSTAASGEQALLLLGPQAGFDVLLSDVALGAGMRGTRLAALAQQRSPRLAVLLMSGYSADLLDADHGEPLRWELLRKPCSRDSLAAALASVLRGSAADRDRLPDGPGR